ncbi:MAG: glutathione S-transferase C-terminal domain-containing protein [Pseudomonadota bacterium]
MGMLIDGKWNDAADQSMVDGTYRRQASALASQIDDAVLSALRSEPERFVLVASDSCPWSHGTVIASVLCGFADCLPVQKAGGPRIEGYGLLPAGPITATEPFDHAHQLYSTTDPAYTGRATVPLLWDTVRRKVLSNSSQDIIAAFVTTGTGDHLRAGDMTADVAQLCDEIFDGLSNAVYRAGKAQRQDEYDDAVDTVFATMDSLEDRLDDRAFLFGSYLTTADVRLFATLVRFDTVYATHFRCTRKRLVDYPALWRFTRRIYRLPGIRQTVDFEAIRFGYYANDGSHNPFGIIGQQPIIDWESKDGLEP